MALGIVLCLLAAVFAFEAKLAWFSPAGSPPAQISASKLQLADAPKLVAQALTVPASPRFPADIPLLLAVALLLLPAVRVAYRGPQRTGDRFQASSIFSPTLFRRPPPQS